LPPGDVLSDPPPQILAFVVVPGNRIVALGPLSPKEVRALFGELSQRRLAHTGNDTGVLVLVASLILLSGGALIGLTKRPRRRAA
jgi:LPXTG-motif cell wall-anchored protein